MASIVYKNSRYFLESFDSTKSIIESIGLSLSLLMLFYDESED